MKPGCVRACLLLCLLALTLFFLSADGCRSEPESPDSPARPGTYLGRTPPGPIPEIFMPDVITEELHGCITFTPDLMEAYWSPMETPGIRFMRIENGVWSEPRRLSFAGHDLYGDAALSPDGQSLYFISSKETSWSAAGTDNIWVSRRLEDGRWGKPEPLDSAADSHGVHWPPSVAANGTVYFGAGDDLYFSRYEEGRYLEPEPVGLPVNSRLYDATPFISPDEGYLIFSRIDLAAAAHADLFVSFRDRDGDWSEPVAMGEAVNGDMHELCPVVTPDGKYLFFLKSVSGILRPHWVDTAIIEDLRPPPRESGELER
jgi:hypothetical protein